jgi:hypothetical protein
VAAMPLGMLEESLRLRLTGISAARIDRLLKSIRVQHPKCLSGTKPGTPEESNPVSRHALGHHAVRFHGTGQGGALQVN